MKKYISIWILIALLFTGCASSREEIPAEPSAPAEKTDNQISMTVFEKVFLPLASGESRPSMEDFTALLEREGIAWREDEGILDVSDPEHEGSYLYGILTNERDFAEIAEMGYHFQTADREYEVKVDMTGKEIKYFVDVTLLDSGTEVPSIADVKSYLYDVIQAEQTAETVGTEIQNTTPSGELLHETDFTLCAGKEGTVQLYGKKKDEYYYGVCDAAVRLEDGTVIPFSVQDGLACYWEQTDVSYTEAWGPDGGLILKDVNFDGYTDIGLQVQTPAYNSPYVYWYYDPDSASYRVLGSFLSPLVVDDVTERCTVEYRDSQVYYREIYKTQGPLPELEERWITEYVDGQSVTRKDPQVG